MKKDNSKEGTSSRNIQTYNSKSVLYYVVQCPTQLVGASAISEPQQQASLRQHSNARRPHAPPVSAVRAAVDSSAVLSKHCPNKKLRKKNLVKLIGVIVRTAAVWRIFGLNCLKSADAPDFVLFFQKKLVKLSEVHVLQRRFDEFCGFWKLESLRRGATVSISNAESLKIFSHGSHPPGM